jgi:hypothetical protein
MRLISETVGRKRRALYGMIEHIARTFFLGGFQPCGIFPISPAVAS